ncbi:glycosyltransferase family 9 protein [Shewanella vesiculosa]|uniref:glycosyltransferase family 9 protein n=1 Tax=Shewanella vesiculosa TaxID=518738 RepID=UPI0023588391|nr:glycosyltransferase family 9 protein [Shewanella vesiculosa]NCP72653.1 glycosyltransferase family 9 protein [Shewanella vesiculosa]
MINLASLNLHNFLRKWALDATVPELNMPIGVVSAEEYFQEMDYRKLGWRSLRRKIFFLLSGQSKYKINTLKNIEKRGLWFYFGEHQIGDALMDLAPRSLLKENGYQLDLITEDTIAYLFVGDPWFDNIYSVDTFRKLKSYDFAIVLNNKRRSIKLKRHIFKTLPWISIQENFSGPDFDRAGYATQRICDLLNIRLTPENFVNHAKQKLNPRLISNKFDDDRTKFSSTVGLCIGGVDPLRTYKGWSPLISKLIRTGHHKFVLIGSENGRKDAELLQREFKDTEIYNFVGCCTIHESHYLLSKVKVVVCADGGLMHLSATTNTPMIALMASSIKPEWRLSLNPTTVCIQSTTKDVNDISAIHIFTALYNLFAKLDWGII